MNIHPRFNEKRIQMIQWNITFNHIYIYIFKNPPTRRLTQITTVELNFRSTRLGIRSQNPMTVTTVKLDVFQLGKDTRTPRHDARHFNQKVQMSRS